LVVLYGQSRGCVCLQAFLLMLDCGVHDLAVTEMYRITQRLRRRKNR